MFKKGSTSHIIFKIFTSVVMTALQERSTDELGDFFLILYSIGVNTL